MPLQSRVAEHRSFQSDGLDSMGFAHDYDTSFARADFDPFEPLVAQEVGPKVRGATLEDKRIAPLDLARVSRVCDAFARGCAGGAPPTSLHGEFARN